MGDNSCRCRDISDSCGARGYLKAVVVNPRLMSAAILTPFSCLLGFCRELGPAFHFCPTNCGIPATGLRVLTAETNLTSGMAKGSSIWVS